jgi:tRNA-2-methylthio-N6-dimethylallyladenosine synthase
VYEVFPSRKRVFDLTELDAAGVVEGLPVRRDGKTQGVGSHIVRLRQFLQLLHCALCPRQRTQPQPGAYRGRRLPPGAGRYREITLLGQNVNSYGKGLPGEITFAALLRRLNEIEGDFLIRFMTSHPNDCTRELIDTVAGCEKLSKLFTCPFRAGATEYCP